MEWLRLLPKAGPFPQLMTDLRHRPGSVAGVRRRVAWPRDAAAAPCAHRPRPTALPSAIAHAASPTAAWRRSGPPRTRSSGALVAVKVLAAGYAADEAAPRAASARGARRRARVATTRNVVTIFDIGEHDGPAAFIVMEHFAGRHGRRPAARAASRSPAPHGAALARATPPRRSTTPTPPTSSTATSSPATCCSTSTGACAVGDFGIARWRDRDVGDADRPGARHRGVPVARAGASGSPPRRPATATRWPSSPTSC